MRVLACSAPKSERGATGDEVLVDCAACRMKAMRERAARQERGEGDEREKKEPLDSDTYGAALFSLVEDISDILGGGNGESRFMSSNAIRLVYMMFVLLANYFLQFGMLFFIKLYVVEPAKEAQKKLEEDEIAEGRHVHIILTQQPLFLFVVLYLWTLTILIQWRGLERFYKAFTGLPFAPRLHNMVNHEEDDEGNIEYEIKGLTKQVWAVIQLVIVLPKVGIVIFLFLLGFEWLASTEEPADLILNALALEFVVNIDEQLFEALLPKCFVEQMQMANLTKVVRSYVGEAGEKAKAIDDITAEWSAFRRAILYYFLPIVVSGGYIIYMQHVLSPVLNE